MISSTLFYTDYVGNASAVTPYPVEFEFLAETDIVVQKSPTGTDTWTTLATNLYTVTRDEDTRLGSVTTSPAISAAYDVRIKRSTPIVQPTAYPESGAFPAESHETALDRLTMIVQEIAGGDGGGALVAPVALRDVVRWEASTDRGGVVPARRGQLGVQMADATLWMAQSTGAGDWTEISGGSGGSTLATFANSTARTGATPLSIGQLGIQLDTVVLYTAASVTIGDWVPISQTNTTMTWADDAARASADPLFIGQLGVQLDDLTLWVSNDLAPGDWELVVTTPSVAAIATHTITGTAIDASLSNSYFKSLTANDAFTFSNFTDARQITCVFANADTYTPTWPAGVVVDWPGTKSIHIVTFINCLGDIYSSTVERDPS